jgi:hypothetical protein
MTDVTEDQDQAEAELSAADEQLVREHTERARAGGLKLCRTPPPRRDRPRRHQRRPRRQAVAAATRSPRRSLEPQLADIPEWTPARRLG